MSYSVSMPDIPCLPRLRKTPWATTYVPPYYVPSKNSLRAYGLGFLMRSVNDNRKLHAVYVLYVAKLYRDTNKHV